MPVTVWEYNAEMKVTGREGGGGEELHNLCFWMIKSRQIRRIEPVAQTGI